MKHGRVVLADSHFNMLGGVHDLLDSQFEIVLMVADERSLIEAIVTFQPALVVVDLSLPGSEEANVATRLKGRFPDLQIIVLSVHDEPTVVSRLMEVASAFVLKRTTAADLIPAIQSVLGGNTYVSPTLSRQWETVESVSQRTKPK